MFPYLNTFDGSESGANRSRIEVDQIIGSESMTRSKNALLCFGSNTINA